MALVNDFGESKVTVKKDALLEAVVKNRAAHADEHLTALLGYRNAVIAKLQMMLKQAEAGKLDETHIGLVEPKSHVKDYDRVIRMLTMSVAEEWTISEQQFSQYVLDEWDWQATFKASTARYMGGR